MKTASSRQKKPKNEKLIRPIRPNAGIERGYQRRLDDLIKEMHKSVVYWLRASYRANPPAMAADDLSANAMRKALDELIGRWLSKFDDMAEKLSGYFTLSISKRSDAALKRILREGGMAIEFKMTAAQRDVLAASIEQNVGLIKSIPARYFSQVENMVMQSVQSGHDLKTLTDGLQKQFGVTRRRAAFIARDQNSKVSAALLRARYVEIGIDESIWRHSHGGKTPRPSHVKAGRDKVRYRVDEGWLDPAINKRIWPGTEINCRCYAQPVLKGFA